MKRRKRREKDVGITLDTLVTQVGKRRERGKAERRGRKKERVREEESEGEEEALEKLAD